MKIRTFRKCINRRKEYRYYPKYTHKILGIGLGQDTRYRYTFLGHPVYLRLNGVYSAMTDRWLGHCYISPEGDYYVYGPDNKGMLIKTNN